MHAAQTELTKKGKRTASNVLKEITTSPTRAKLYKKAYYRTKSSENKTCPLSLKRALQMFIDADLTREQYETIRSTNKHFFPCYSLLQKEKKKCYPPSDSCTISMAGYYNSEKQKTCLCRWLINRTKGADRKRQTIDCLAHRQRQRICGRRSSSL